MTTLRYIGKRILQTLIVLFFVSIFAFLLIQEAIPANRIAGVVIIFVASLINLSPMLKQLRRHSSPAQP